MRHLFYFVCLLFPLMVSAQPGQELHLESKTLKTASGIEIKAETGYLTVLENRADKSSTPIKLEFIRLKSNSPKPIAPVFYLEGGPGASASWMADSPYAYRQRWPPHDLGHPRPYP